MKVITTIVVYSLIGIAFSLYNQLSSTDCSTNSTSKISLKSIQLYYLQARTCQCNNIDIYHNQFYNVTYPPILYLPEIKKLLISNNDDYEITSLSTLGYYFEDMSKFYEVCYNLSNFGWRCLINDEQNMGSVSYNRINNLL
jgi:hypothetical protein